MRQPLDRNRRRAHSRGMVIPHQVVQRVPPSRWHSRTDLVVSEYLAAWNAADAGARRRHLEASWSPTGHFEDPFVALDDREALGEHIERARARYSGARLVVTSDVIEHHGRLHLAWALIDAHGDERLEGSSYVVLDDAGLIRHLVAFFEGKPAAD